VVFVKVNRDKEVNPAGKVLQDHKDLKVCKAYLERLDSQDSL
jgi:hypothetical protein